MLRYLLLALLFSCLFPAKLVAQRLTKIDTLPKPIWRTYPIITTVVPDSLPVVVAADQTERYLPLLQNRRVALVVNHTSLVNNTRHLVDLLLDNAVIISKVFAPEHGFRGTAAAGETVRSGIDAGTGLPLVSLYGKNKKPTAEQLSDVDVVVFDIQDVGARFYTYISTLHYVMEACAENGVQLVVLDRPNPNGFYVDGPMLDVAHRSFVGLDSLPVVHGLTMGELARMINGENWLKGGKKCDLIVVPCLNYTHQVFYELPVKPSPSLTHIRGIYWYPSLCFFEGTNVSLGRGTEHPFEQIGAPQYVGRFTHTFTPTAIESVPDPPFKDQRCYGLDLSQMPLDSLRQQKGIQLSYLLKMYQAAPDKKAFFLANRYFDTLAGTSALRQQIEQGWTEAQIRDSWQVELEKFKQKRRAYLLYPE